MHIDFLNSTIKSDAVMIKELELYVSEQNLEHAKYIEYLHTAFEESFLINNEDFQRRLDRINNKIKTLKNKINQTKHEIYTKSLEQ